MGDLQERAAQFSSDEEEENPLKGQTPQKKKKIVKNGLLISSKKLGVGRW